MRWCKSSRDDYIYTTPVYTRNLSYSLTDSPWEFSAFYELAKNVKNVILQKYLKEYKKHPAYEYLIKARLYKLVTENMDNYYNFRANLNFEGKRVHEILSISKAGFKQIQRLNGGCQYLALIQLAEKMGKSMTDEQLRIFAKMNLYSNLLEDLLEITSPQKIINYIDRCKECREEEKHLDSATNIATYWRDYLKNCKLLGYDLKNDFNIFPKNLKVRHDEVVAIYKVEENAIQEKAIAELHITLQEVFGYTNKELGLISLVPSSREEIITEGQILRHCVHTGSYIQRMIEGTGYIIFIRKADSPETPFFTAEVVDGVIQQCRGLKNCGMTDDVKKFVSNLQKSLIKADVKSFNAKPAAAVRVIA